MASGERGEVGITNAPPRHVIISWFGSDFKPETIPERTILMFSLESLKSVGKGSDQSDVRQVSARIDGYVELYVGFTA